MCWMMMNLEIKAGGNSSFWWEAQLIGKTTLAKLNPTCFYIPQSGLIKLDGVGS